MRRPSAAVFGVAAAVMTVGMAPSASAQPGTFNPEAQFIRTAGNVRCVVSAEKASCERDGGFPAAPVTATGGHWPVASVDADGKFSWAEAGIGPTVGQEVTMINGQPYRFHGWTLLLTIEGTRLTNVDSVHGMNISIDGVGVTPY
ncbi:hypothetical protein [Mycolicibacterium tusciae]|uniref:hypothetical protein n=1 Tax=Mycolicibacterium tusciae TaxID=75922 RepID=UPI00024A2E5B|nr:hypothetical protein [Mycolicibacterium tusciae]